jgi:HSP20 family molecular chaperone IbpA
LVVDDENKDSKRKRSRDDASIDFSLVGAIFPGLGNLLDELKKSSDFKDRLAEANDQIERRVRTNIPPGGSKPNIDFHVSVRTLVDGKEVYRYSRTKGSARGMGRKAPVEVLDIIEAGDHLVAIVELHGIDEKDVEAKVEGKTKMILQVKSGYVDETELPAPVTRVVERKFSNSILQLRLEKWKERDGEEKKEKKDGT